MVNIPFRTGHRKIHISPSFLEDSHLNHINNTILINSFGFTVLQEPGSSVGMATCYWLEGPGIDSRLGRDSAYLSKPALGPTHPPIQWVPGLFPGGKSSGAWR